MLGMPKKFQGENSKAMTAKARKAEAKAVEDSRKKKELEDALWQENDKHVLKKEQRKVIFHAPFLIPTLGQIVGSTIQLGYITIQYLPMYVQTRRIC